MRSWQRQRWPTDTPTFHILIACANIYFHTIYFYWKLNRKAHFRSCNKALTALLFQPRTVYSFLKLQLLKTEGDNSRVLRREWRHWKGRSCDSRRAQRCTALELSGSGHSKFSAWIVPLESQGNSRWTVCTPHMQGNSNVLCVIMRRLWGWIAVSQSVIHHWPLSTLPRIAWTSLLTNTRWAWCNLSTRLIPARVWIWLSW